MVKTKRKLSSWNVFVMNLKKKHPEKSFKNVLKLASQLKKKGTNYLDFVKVKTEKVVKKIRRTVKLNKKRKNKKRKTSKRN